MPRLSLVIPCYNEAPNLPSLVERCKRVVAEADAEVILVDNGSTDGSQAALSGLVASNPGIRTVRVEVNQGYGFGVMAGLRAADGTILAWTHADLQTDPVDVLQCLALYDQASDPQQLFVKGRRQGRPLGDVVFTVGMSIFESLLFGSLFWDINAQPTMFHRGFVDRWEQPPNDFSLDLYAYHQARKHGLDIRRLPVRFGERLHGQSHWNVDWRSKVRFIKRTLGYSLALRRNRAR